ncbi:MAG: HAMP domain-containing histidine kinase [Gemmatimonadetes bacterium]|nr:HAMP domain-containing histidine kinase [Gemmatimonadota bacterium]
MKFRTLPLLNLAAVVVVMVLDGFTPAGVVIGMLACVPILLSSVSDEPRDVWLVFGVAVVGFLIAAYWGHAPVSPASVWVPNRLVAFLSFPLSAALALLLQKHRLSALAARDQAVSTGELNRLLMSLLAHDLRSPLALADQGFEYVEESVRDGYPVDRGLVADVRARLQRSLRAIEMVLTLARADASGDGASARAAVPLREEIEAEIASFAHEAGSRGKTLVAELDGVAPGAFTVNVLVLRQVLAILLDNAVRYAVPGPVRICAWVEDGVVEITVADTGPGLSAHRGGAPRSDGSGLGLRLCSALLGEAGGGLRTRHDGPDGTEFLVRLPAAPAASRAVSD